MRPGRVDDLHTSPRSRDTELGSAHGDAIDQLPRLLCRARALAGERTDLVAARGFDRQHPTRYVIIHLVVLLQIELRVLTKRGLDAHAASLDLPSRLIACSSGRSQSQ
jgi:hypothetical protein